MTFTRAGSPINRAWFARDAVEVAPELLGAVLTHHDKDGSVSARLTEIEAYRGHGTDPGSHAFRGPTPRTAVMFGEPAHTFVYLTYGMHTMLNFVCAPMGTAAAVLLRAGEIVDGLELARTRRLGVRDRDLARGPARHAQALGISLAENGADLFQPGSFTIELPLHPSAFVRTPRTGVSGPGGSQMYDWRFAEVDLAGRIHATVLPYKRHPRSFN